VEDSYADLQTGLDHDFDLLILQVWMDRQGQLALGKPTSDRKIADDCSDASHSRLVGTYERVVAAYSHSTLDDLLPDRFGVMVEYSDREQVMG
jgi:hypothetical protein